MIKKQISTLTDSFFIIFGTWTIFAQISYFIGISFKNLVLLYLGLLPFILFGLLILWKNDEKQEDFPRKIEFYILLLFIGLGILLALILDRPDSDDHTYLAMTISVIDFPDIPIFSEISQKRFSKYFLSSYDTFRAAITYITGIPVLTSYYLIVPGFFSAIIVLIHWRLFDLLLNGKWILPMLVFFLIMVIWGDAHRTPPNFGFVRMAQGKACLVSITVPAILFYFFKYQTTGRYQDLFLMLFAMIGGIGFTPSAIFVELILIFLLIIVRIAMKEKILPEIIKLILLSSYPLLIAFYIKFILGYNSRGVHMEQGVITWDRSYSDIYNLELIYFVLGKGFRAYLAIIALVVWPLCVSNLNLKKYIQYLVTGFVILLIFPWTSVLIAKIAAPSSSWRWLWIIPFPAIMAICAVRIYEFSYKKLKGAYILGAIMTFFIISSPRWVVSSMNYTSIMWPAERVNNRETVELDNYGKGEMQNGNLVFKRLNKVF